MTIFERCEAANASANCPSNDDLASASCSAVKFLPTAAKILSHIVTYSSIMAGTAGSVIWPVTTDRRYNRRAMASRNSVGFTDPRGGFSIRFFVHDRAAVATAFGQGDSRT